MKTMAFTIAWCERCGTLDLSNASGGDGILFIPRIAAVLKAAEQADESVNIGAGMVGIGASVTWGWEAEVGAECKCTAKTPIAALAGCWRDKQGEPT